MIDAGATIGGRYQIVRVIGHGGMGEVYEAVQAPLGRKVALKTIRTDLAQKPALIARFRREAESAAALGHPNIVQVTDFYDVPGETPFIVMEMLEGQTRAEVLEREKRLDPQRASFIAVQLLSGLAAAHRAGIIHRDVKPANIFLQSTTAVRDLVKVLDFGIAKLEEDASAGARPMTRAGEVLGTYAYMAPEQRISGRTVDARTDVYGVGATLFHALSGLRVLEATTPGAGRTPLSQIAHWVHRDLAAIIERSLADSMDARFASAEEMAAALQPFAAGTGSQVPGSATPSGVPPARASGLDAAAMNRMSAPTGGSMFGASSYGESSFGPPNGTTGTGPTAYATAAPTAYASSPPPGVGSTPPPQRASQPSNPQLGKSGGGWNMYAATPPPGAVPPAAPSSPSGPQGFQAPAAAALPFGSVRDYGAIPGHGPTHMQGPSVPYGPMGAMQPPTGAMPMYAGHPMPAKSGGVPWWVFVLIGLVVVGMGAPYIVSMLAIRNATNPETIANNVEREVLKQPRPPCPSPDSCTLKREEHGLVYPLCTKRTTRSSEYKLGDMVLAGSDERIAFVNGPAEGGKFSIRYLTKQGEETVGENEIFGRLCRAGSRSD